MADVLLNLNNALKSVQQIRSNVAQIFDGSFIESTDDSDENVYVEKVKKSLAAVNKDIT